MAHSKSQQIQHSKLVSFSEIHYKAMEAYPMGKVCQRRRHQGEIQYLVKTGSEAVWINADQMDTPSWSKKIETFMVHKHKNKLTKI